ncbi:MAG: hypothetical protein ACO1QR_05175 [Chthoniobacteraceae bacterium]
MKRNPDPHFPQRSRHPLPSETDFDPHGGDLDAQSAWRSFGNLSLEQAYSLFRSRPEVYQEDFMFMGCRAFEYYFPVIDRYLRETTRGEDDAGDCEASILGTAVAAQFEWNDAVLSPGFVQEINALQEFVVLHVDRYAATSKERRRILREWQRVAELCEKHK